MADKEKKEKKKKDEKKVEKKGKKAGKVAAEEETGKEKKIGTYTCITCDKNFKVEAGEKPRCPTCMSIHSVEPYVRKGVKISKQNIRFAAILAVLLVVAVGVYFIMEYKYKKGPVDLSSKYALTHEELLKSLEEHGISADSAFDPFASGEALKAFAQNAVKGSSSKSKGEKLHNALLDFKNRGMFISFLPRQPRQQEPMSAGDVFNAVKKNEKVALYSLELAALYVTAARLAGMNAVVAKVDDYRDMDAPLDPSGNVGHFAAAVYQDKNCWGKAVLYDLHQGKTFPDEVAAFAPLNDVQVVASYMGHEAFYLSGVQFDFIEARSRIEDAISLYASSAELYSLKGLIYMVSGGLEQGKQQMRKAMTIKKDAQRILNWGAILAAEGEEEEALAQIRKAIDMKSRYAMAHATLAMALLATGESDEAREELDRAKEIDPHDPLIPLFEAHYYIERGQVGKAVEYAEKAFDKSYGDPHVGMFLAALYAQTGERSRMAKVLDRLLENENLPDEIKTQIKDQFGYEPGDEDDEELEEDEMELGFGGSLQKKGGLLSSSGPPTLGGKPSLGGGSIEDDEELDEEDEDPEEDAFKLKMGTSKGGLLTGKGSGMDLELK